MARGMGLVDVGQDRAEVAVADHEHEGGRAVDLALRNHPSAAAGLFVAMVAGAGLAADLEGAAVLIHQCALQPPRGAVVHHLDQGTAHRGGHLGGQHLLRARMARLQPCLVGRVAREVQGADPLRGQPHAVVREDAHQLRQGGRPVARRADRARIRRRQRCERVTHALP
ncbi:hypothetical protein D9M70_557050 [compost metagenome]